MAVAYCEQCGKKVSLKSSGACSLCGHQIIEKEPGSLGCGAMIGIAVAVVAIGITIRAVIDNRADEKRELAYQQQLIEQKKKREQEAKEKAEREQRRAERAAERKAKEQACAKSINCLAEKKSSFAEIYCPDRIERYAKNDFRWTDDDMFEPKFSKFRIKDEKNGIVTYIGDDLMFQNGFGAWVNVRYTCDINVKTETVLTVNVMEGRL